MKHAFFATPSYSGVPCQEYLGSLERTAALCEASGWAVSYQMVVGDCYVQNARNTLVRAFLDSQATHLLFLDDDMGWPERAALSLLEMPDDIVCGAYPFKDKPGYPIVINADEDGYPRVRADGCIDTAAAPTGFLRISRQAIERLCAAYPGQQFEVQGPDSQPIGFAYDLFPQGVKHGRWWGEDFAFCLLWTGIGGEIWCVPDIDFAHVGKQTVHGNYHRYLVDLACQQQEAS